MNKLLIAVLFFVGTGNLSATENKNVLIIPLLDSHYQVTRMQYPGTGGSVGSDIAIAVVTGLLTGIAVVPGRQQLTLNQATHYRPYMSDIKLEEIVISRLRKAFSVSNNFNIYGTEDVDEKAKLVKNLLVKNKLYGKAGKSEDFNNYIEMLKDSGFDKIVFVTNQSSIFQYGSRKKFPLHGFGLFYDVRQDNATHATYSYFGASIEVFDMKSKESIGDYTYAEKILMNVSSNGANKLRSRNVIKFLESKYEKPITELPQYGYLLSEAITRSHGSRVLKQYKEEIYSNDRNKGDYNKLRSLLNLKVHHQYGEFSAFDAETKAAMMKHAAMVFENDNFNITDYIDLRDTSGDDEDQF